jgi:competence protein ComEC
MYRWIPYAFVRIAIFFCSGIIVAIHYGEHLSVNILFISGLTLAMAFVLCVIYHKGKSLVAGMLASMTLIVAGMLNVRLSDQSQDASHLLRQTGEIKAFRAVIESAVSVRPRTWKYEVYIDRVMKDGHWVDTFSRALLYIRKDSTGKQYDYGDVLVIRDTPRRIPGPANPGEFDLQKFQRYRQVYFQVITRAAQISCIRNQPSHEVTRLAITARLWAEGTIVRHVHGDRARAIASAFVLGVTDGLDGELTNAYAATGAMHVLSVSGLHVGIVYWLLLLLFKPFHPNQARWPLLVISLLVLWVYAFVTGISASVLRAVVMFSFAAIARAWNYPINLYNILAATAFVLLVYDPFMLMSVGFQLSFVAVVGIVALQPVLYRLWEPTAWLWDELWKICAVSIAAQLATLPLCLLYFHQFPNYFLLANLFMGPGSFVVLILGILVLLLGAFDSAARVIGWVLEKLIDLLNLLILSVEGLPYSVVPNIFITPLQCAVLTGVVASVMIWCNGHSRWWIALAAGMFTVFPMLSWQHSLETRSPSITVYAIPEATAVDLMSDHVTAFIGSPEARANGRQTSANRIARQCADRVVNMPGANLQPGIDLYVWHRRRIVRVHGPTASLPFRFRADLVIISNNAVKDLGTFSRSIVAKCYVIDGTNGRTSSERLAAQADTLTLRVHAVMRDGAYEWRL